MTSHTLRREVEEVEIVDIVAECARPLQLPCHALHSDLRKLHARLTVYSKTRDDCEHVCSCLHRACLCPCRCSGRLGDAKMPWHYLQFSIPFYETRVVCKYLSCAVIT